MRWRWLSITALVIFLIAASVFSAAGQTGITVNDADATWETGIATSSGLEAVLATVTARVIVTYSDLTQGFGLIEINEGFQNLLNQVAKRISLIYADGNSQLDLTQPSDTFSGLLNQTISRLILQYSDGNSQLDLVQPNDTFSGLLVQLASRVSFQYADGNNSYAMNYPIALIGDSTPPLIDNITESQIGSGTMTIGWRTNEFANSRVAYGSSSGNYTQSATAADYVTQHALQLTGLTINQTYYYQISSTDLSGNTATSAEGSFVIAVDTTPPQISNVTVMVTAEKTAVIQWQTNELADSQVAYGTQSGNYTESLSDGSFVTTHQISLTGLAAGSYYFQVRSVDQNGNTAVSSEHTFIIDSETAEYQLYLPLIVR